MKILYYTGWTLIRLISKIVFRIKVYGCENIPKEGGFIVASNHISYYDPPLVGSWNSRQIYFMAKKELFEYPIFGNIIRRTNALPVKRGVIDRNALEEVSKVINNGYGITIFPEGTRSKNGQFLPPKPGIGMIARQAECAILPAYINGSNRLWDCFIGRARMSITYGQVITSDEIKAFSQDKEGYHQIAQAVMERIKAIKAARQ